MLLLRYLLLVEFLALLHQLAQDIILTRLCLQHAVLRFKQCRLLLKHLLSQILLVMNKLLGISGTPVHLCDGGRREHKEERTDLPALGACISDCLLELGLLGTQFSLYLRDIALQAQEFALQPVQFSLQPMDMLQPLVELYIQIADGLLAALHLLAGTVEFVLRLLERLLQFGLLAL